VREVQASAHTAHDPYTAQPRLSSRTFGESGMRRAIFDPQFSILFSTFQQLGSTALFKLPQSSEYAGRTAKMNSSEAKLRAERDSQIMKRSVVQVDFIACLQSQSDGSPETLKTGTGIHSEVRPRTSNSGNSVAEIA